MIMSLANKQPTISYRPRTPLIIRTQESTSESDSVGGRNGERELDLEGGRESELRAEAREEVALSPQQPREGKGAGAKGIEVELKGLRVAAMLTRLRERQSCRQGGGRDCRNKHQRASHRGPTTVPCHSYVLHGMISGIIGPYAISESASLSAARDLHKEMQTAQGPQGRGPNRDQLGRVGIQLHPGVVPSNKKSIERVCYGKENVDVWFMRGVERLRRGTKKSLTVSARFGSSAYVPGAFVDPVGEPGLCCRPRRIGHEFERRAPRQRRQLARRQSDARETCAKVSLDLVVVNQDVARGPSRRLRRRRLEVKDESLDGKPGVRLEDEEGEAAYVAAL